MTMKKSIVVSCVILFFLPLFFSCGTANPLNGLRVPGERQILIKNISSEYFNIAEGYMDLKKYDKAAEYYKLAMGSKELKASACYKLARCYALSKK